MEQLVQNIYKIIKDYREDEGKMSIQRINEWILQFPEADREFILIELIPILKKRYFSKKRILLGLENIIVQIAKELGYNSPVEFLKESIFIDHQPEGKSQRDFLEILNEISIEKFGLNILHNNTTTPKHFIYLDDLLCTGDTLFKGLAKIEANEKRGWLFQNFNGQSHIEYMIQNKSKILILYFAIHKHNYSNFEWRLQNHLKDNIKLNEKIINYLEPYAFEWIENDFKNTTSKLDYLFPIKENQSPEVIEYFNSLDIEDKGVFRSASKPIEEKFFSSKDHRIRFENIILEQSLRLYDLAGESRNIRMRPLGYGLSSHKNLGFGTMCFTYRNVPFKTPLVFWYTAHHNWIPLFERKFVNYGE